MEKVMILPAEKLINGWISPEFIPEGEDKYSIRNRQVRVPKGGWRHLRSGEIERLVRGANTASSWDTVWVTDEFDPEYIKNSHFLGTVRIGRVSGNGLQYHDLRLPVGITNSSIHSCDIGDDCAIHDVHYLSHYIIGDRCMLFNIHEMSTTDHSKFGNGIVKEGESESVRTVIEVMNETGCRAVYPFDGMITADAYLWAKYIDNRPLQARLREITQASCDSRRGYYGTVGDGCVIKTSGIIKDAKIGPACYIKGASKLKNITINSSEREPSQIGENVILVNGIVGLGCRIFYGCIAVKFVVGNNCNLKYGARVINSILGDNSTISCCEVLNNLIFPSHEQHHNNSFLIAAVTGGQSNMAAGATIGSNHNSRANDNEIVAGRGFWPGLCTSIKHSSRFACYTLLAKGAYPFELNVPLPFCLVSNNESRGELELRPAYWWIHNMYALTRNDWKYSTRDKRVTKIQNIEYETFAPDSMEEVISARKLLEIWTAKAWMARSGEDYAALPDKRLRAVGAGLLDGDDPAVDSLEVFGENIEKGKRRARIIGVRRAYRAYGDMLIHYAFTNVLRFLADNPSETLASISDRLRSRRHREWVNLGGQLVMTSDLERLKADICEGRLDSWKDIHHRYNELWKRYPVDKLHHAVLSLCYMLRTDSMTPELWSVAIDREMSVQVFIRENVRASRLKDYDNPFRRLTFDSDVEMEAAFGKFEDNTFIRNMDASVESALARLSSLRSSL